jgi:hypothetical protein
MPLLPETLLPSRLESWLTLLGDFSNAESVEPLKPPRRLPASSAFRPRKDSELALLNTFFTTLRGGEVTGEPVVGDSIAYLAEAEGNGASARLAVGITLAWGLEGQPQRPACRAIVTYVRIGHPLFCEMVGLVLALGRNSQHRQNAYVDDEVVMIEAASKEYGVVLSNVHRQLLPGPGAPC